MLLEHGRVLTCTRKHHDLSSEPAVPPTQEEIRITIRNCSGLQIAGSEYFAAGALLALAQSPDTLSRASTTAQAAEIAF